MPMHHPQPLTSEQTRRLSALHNHSTLYEAVIERADGAKMLLSYCCQHNKAGLRSSVYKHAAAILAFLGLDEGAQMRDVRGRAEIEISSEAVARFSGRTQRDAITEGELPFIGA